MSQGSLAIDLHRQTAVSLAEDDDVNLRNKDKHLTTGVSWPWP
ncbi:hypothetical protein C4K03_3234 [Pseudomonas synxantha]|uniref:Uncharacterized protein n=1 Tax=Pseudomonas synxantha TaxID=47883 RepID=A0A3G7UA29_9PSED|nr:hypothetical protein C4K03_3234 [Pseudomonas synxantha]